MFILYLCYTINNCTFSVPLIEIQITKKNFFEFMNC